MQVRYQQREDLFFQRLKERVHGYFREHAYSTYANPAFFIKAGVLVSLYVGCYLMIWLLGSQVGWLFLGYMGMGALAILVGLNLAHDAAHGTISPHRKVNQAFCMVFDLLGANSFMWRNRHVFAHHAFPNVLDQDSDIQQVDFVRIFPHAEKLKVHKWQHIYMPFVYLLYTLHWLWRRDFTDFWANNIGAFKAGKIPSREYLKLIGFKLLYLTYVLILPLIWVPQPAWVIVLAFIAMNMTASMVIAVALVSAHVGEDAVFPQVDREGKLPYTWAEHQLITTADFATQNPVVNFLFGGFNHHVVHHLFPRICHIHYPALTPMVAETAAEFGLPYHCEPLVSQAILSHWRLLRERGWNSWQMDEEW